MLCQLVLQRSKVYGDMVSHSHWASFCPPPTIHWDWPCRWSEAWRLDTHIAPKSKKARKVTSLLLTSNTKAYTITLFSSDLHVLLLFDDLTSGQVCWRMFLGHVMDLFLAPVTCQSVWTAVSTHMQIHVTWNQFDMCLNTSRWIFKDKNISKGNDSTNKWQHQRHTHGLWNTWME